MVRTADDWHLTIFRVTGRKGSKPNNTSKKKYPVLCQHGAFDSAIGWSGRGVSFKPSLPLSLVDRGYDVWLGNNRGTRYSNLNEKDGQWTLEDRWDFSWAEMGAYDNPAIVNKILRVTGQEKVTLIGYS